LGVEAAFFDLDKTVIARASVAAFGRPFYRGGLISRRVILRVLYAQLIYLYLGASEEKLERIRESMLVLTRGWDQAQVRQIVRETLDVVVEPIIYAEALELIAEHQSAGRLVYLVSASPEEIVEPLAGYLGVDGAIASRAVVDADGRYTGDMAFYAYGPLKADAIREEAERMGIDLSGSFAYSDSYTDIPMLETVGHPIAVNPDRILTKAAKERGWEIQKFDRPVRLRDRVRVPRWTLTAAVASIGAAGTALGAAALWRRTRGSSLDLLGGSVVGQGHHKLFSAGAWLPRRLGKRVLRVRGASS